jgi:hypothetical protein
MYLLIGILMLLVIGSFILIVTGAAELDKLRSQNRYLVEQIARIRTEQSDLLKALQQAPVMAEPVAQLAAVGAPAAAVAAVEAVPAALSAPGPESAPLAEPTAVVDDATMKKMKGNARSLQTVVEGFALDHAGAYPGSLKELEAYAVANAANIPVTNPFTGVAGFITDADLSLDISETAVDEGIVSNAGKLLYQANTMGDQVSGYMIAALDGQGFLLKESDGVPFTLGV